VSGTVPITLHTRRGEVGNASATYDDDDDGGDDDNGREFQTDDEILDCSSRSCLTTFPAFDAL
jgi:hypothetical protein